jgi:DNA-binding Lrp family transcriptional regulator
MRGLVGIDRALVKLVVSGCNRDEIEKVSASGGVSVEEVRQHLKALLHDKVISACGEGRYTTSWTAEDIERGFKE